jgi:glycosyltransferase involved in cell wall biosynthesis
MTAILDIASLHASRRSSGPCILPGHVSRTRSNLKEVSAMRIIHITNSVAPDKLGGLERYVRELAARSVADGHEVAVVAKRTSPHQTRVERGEDGVVIVRYDQPSKRNPFFALLYPLQVPLAVRAAVMTARKQIGGSKMSIVHHAHFPIPALVLALTTKDFVYTCHAPVYKEILSERQNTYRLPRLLQRMIIGVARRVEAFVIGRASQVITLSSFVRGEVEAMGVSSRHNFVLIPGGIDTDYFRPDPAESRRDAVLFTARRLVERTGVEDLLRAMPSIVRRHPSIELRIAGQGPRQEAVQALIESLGLSERVTLLGRISEDQLRNEYQAATVCVTPTKFLEGFGLSTVEALACGAPVVVTPVGANEEVVSGLPDGLVSLDASATEIAVTILSLLADLRKLEDVGQRARGHVHPRFGWPAVVTAHVGAYSRGK